MFLASVIAFTLNGFNGDMEQHFQTIRLFLYWKQNVCLLYEEHFLQYDGLT